MVHWQAVFAITSRLTLWKSIALKILHLVEVLDVIISRCDGIPLSLISPSHGYQVLCSNLCGNAMAMLDFILTATLILPGKAIRI